MDVGGTFTDIVALCEDGRIVVKKVLTAVRSPSGSVAEGLRGASSLCGEEGGVLVHATTLATNALLGQRGLEPPKVGLLVTKGFGGLLEIGRQNRPRLYDPGYPKPRPLVSQELVLEVTERTLSDGRIERPVSEEEVKRLVAEALSKGASSLAISFLHSYANPSNEISALRVAKELVRYVVASSQVSPSPREYERTSTAVVNAALMPTVDDYLSGLVREARELGFKGVYVMSSSGGLVSVEEVMRRPAVIVESGPAAGVAGAAVIAEVLGERRVIAFDMGGTTAKASTIVDFSVQVVAEYEVGGETHHGRVVKGSGYPIRYPFVDVVEVSAGGGTVIWRDKSGALRVGPYSVGAFPGPMCYGLGGKEPTITDANVALGRIPAERISGGIALRRDLAVEGLSMLGDPLKVSEEALKLVNLEMARAIRLVTVERGHDPTDFVLMAYGGGGPLHAADLVSELGIGKVVVPPLPGLFSSLGLLISDYIAEASAFVRKGSDLEQELSRLEKAVRDALRELGGRGVRIIRLAEVRYKGQGWELLVRLPSPVTWAKVKETFDEVHERTFGYSLDEEVEVNAIRAIGVSENPIKQEVLRRLLSPAHSEGASCERADHKVVMNGELTDASVVCRGLLESLGKLEGPAVVLDYGSTIFIPPGWTARCGKLGVIVIER